MSKEIMVSIITPCFNSGKFIEKNILSVLAQDYPYVEHIIHDGGSTDDTVEILKKYSDRVDWISERDQGQADGLNRALQRCRGNVIGVLNADDEYLPHAARWAVENLARHPEAAVVYGQQNNIDEDGNILSISEGPHPYNFKKIFSCDQVIPAQAAFIRRDCLEAVGFYADASLPTCPDYEMWVRLGLKFPMLYVPGIVANYRLHLGSEGQQEKVIHRMVDSKQSVVERVCRDPGTPVQIRRMRRRAQAGIYSWSASHFLPPMLTHENDKALRQFVKSFSTFPRLDTAIRIILIFLSKLPWLKRIIDVSSNFPEMRRVLRRIFRENLRRMDKVFLGELIYKRIYLSRKKLSG